MTQLGLEADKANGQEDGRSARMSGVGRGRGEGEEEEEDSFFYFFFLSLLCWTEKNNNRKWVY